MGREEGTTQRGGFAKRLGSAALHTRAAPVAFQGTCSPLREQMKGAELPSIGPGYRHHVDPDKTCIKPRLSLEMCSRSSA